MNEMLTSWWQSVQDTIAPLRQRWLLLAPREQQLLRLLGIFVVLLALIYGIWLPSRHAAENARQQYVNNRALLMQLQKSIPVSRRNSSAGSMLGNVSALANANNLALSRIQPEGNDQVRVWVDKADFNIVAAWLTKLAEQGVDLREAQVEKQGDGNGISARFVLSR